MISNFIIYDRSLYLFGKKEVISVFDLSAFSLLTHGH